MKRILTGLLVLFMVSACDQARLYEKNITIKDNEWNIDNPLVFMVPVEDTSASYNVYINVRNAGFYRYSNLYLFVNTIFPGGQLQRDTLECILAAPDGKWLGEGLGDIWDNRILFKNKIQFPVAGEYRFEIIQAMRINPLPGIMDAGIRIEKAVNGN